MSDLYNVTLSTARGSFGPVREDLSYRDARAFLVELSTRAAEQEGLKQLLTSNCPEELGSLSICNAEDGSSEVYFEIVIAE